MIVIDGDGNGYGDGGDDDDNVDDHDGMHTKLLCNGLLWNSATMILLGLAI